MEDAELLEFLKQLLMAWANYMHDTPGPLTPEEIVAFSPFLVKVTLFVNAMSIEPTPPVAGGE